MSDNGLTAMSEREEIEMLLPWYVTGKLSDTERERVERYLDSHPQARDQLALVQDECEASETINEALGSPRARALDRMLAQIDAADGPAIQRALRSGIFERVGAWLGAFDTPVLQLAGIAAALVIVVQATVIGALIGGPGGKPQYETATGAPQAAVVGIRLLVAFAGDAKAGDISAFLLASGATIVSGPKGSGLYEIRISGAPGDDVEVERVIAGLKTNPAIIRFVTRAE